MRRPSSIAEVAEWSSSGEEFTLHLKDFLHEFQRSPNLESLLREPPALAGRFDKGHIADAYLAAVAVHLSQRSANRTFAVRGFCEG